LQVKKVLAEFKKTWENHRELGCAAALHRETAAQVRIILMECLSHEQSSACPRAYVCGAVVVYFSTEILLTHGIVPMQARCSAGGALLVQRFATSQNQIILASEH